MKGGSGGRLSLYPGNFRIQVPQMARNALEILQISYFWTVLLPGMGTLLEKIKGPLEKTLEWGLKPSQPPPPPPPPLCSSWYKKNMRKGNILYQDYLPSSALSDLCSKFLPSFLCRSSSSGSRGVCTEHVHTWLHGTPGQRHSVPTPSGAGTHFSANGKYTIFLSEPTWTEHQPPAQGQKL